MSSDQPVEDTAAENTEQKAAQKASRRRRWMVGSLIAAASLVLILSVLALWIRRVVLDSDGYNTTTAQLLQQPEIQQALATNLVDQLYGAENDFFLRLKDLGLLNVQSLLLTRKGLLGDPLVQGRPGNNVTWGALG